MTEHHTDIECDVTEDENIPSLCKKTFLSIARAEKMLYIAIFAVVLPAVGAGITWAFTMGNGQTRQDDKIMVLEEKKHELETKINGKLDELIKRGHERRE